MKKVALTLLLMIAAQAAAQDATELYDCVDDADGLSTCTSDSTAVLVDDGCGVTFNRYRGRIAWPVLRNVGPVTISVKTRVMRWPETTIHFLPLYVEVVGHTGPGDPCHSVAGIVVLEAQGGADCGGTWESVGPINLASFGVPLGWLYHVQVPFFESRPLPSGSPFFHTLGFSCIRITSHPTAIASSTWSMVKQLYQ